jgi:hypothetical protein
MISTLWSFILTAYEMCRRQVAYWYTPLLPYLDPTLPRDLGDQILEEFDETIDFPLSTVAITIFTDVAPVISGHLSCYRPPRLKLTDLALIK